jgi:hypothetical protein
MIIVFIALMAGMTLLLGTFVGMIMIALKDVCGAAWTWFKGKD